MNSDERKIVAEARQTVQKLVVLQGGWQTCLNCGYWTNVVSYDANGNRTEHFECSLYAATPPPQIIVNGCRDHDNTNNIPF